MTLNEEGKRLLRRQRVYRHFAAVALALMLVGLTVRYGFRQEWGQWLFLVGVLVNVLGFAAAPLLHPKPLHER